ncbi:MAG: isoprenylcysteine carboxylmethyltransferase family protein [Acidobacteriaceae bacterium]|nr:isoprenylcysteine carboxylmethyltransferase family protein [Acidobacteriaceae bacterium]
MTHWQTIARQIRVPLGFAFAAFYMWAARPNKTSMLVGGAIILVGLAIRAVAAGHVVKDRRLTVTGPYAYTRHPLYLGSLIIAAGFAVASLNELVALAMVVMFLAIYLPVIRLEEYYLKGAYRDRFDAYAREVPMLLPRLTAFQSGGSFSRQQYWINREYNAFIGAALLMAALVVKVRFWP